MVNLRGIDLNLLTILQALLVEESVSRAAVSVGLSQPGTSQALGRLRALFGDRLLERREGRLRRTAFATLLLPKLNAAMRATKAVFAAEEDFDPRLMQSEMNLAVTDYVSGLLLPKLLHTVKVESPALDLRITLTDRPSVADALRSGRADLALGVFGPSVTGFRTETLFEDDFVIVGRAEHPIFRIEALRPADLTHYDWMLVSALGDAVGQLDDALRPLGLERRVLLTVPIFMHVPLVVADSDLLVALGRRFSQMAIAHWPLDQRELPLRVSSFTANMMWLAQRNDDPALAWLRSRIQTSI